MDYPKLRPVEALPTQEELIALRDPQGFSDKLLLVPPPLFFVVSLFDGRHSLLDIQEEYTRTFGELLFREKVRQIVEQLDEALFLDSDRFRLARARMVEEFRAATVRQATHAGVSYEARPEQLERQLASLFTDPEGPGPPDSSRPSGRLRALIAPHIDLNRGGRCFAWSYAELARECRANTFVILGIAHVPTRHPFVLTAKDFQSPIGPVAADRDFLKELDSHCRTNFYEDEFVHRNEHSVEFQTLFLKYLYRESEKLKIVPILCSLPPQLYHDGEITGHTEIEEFIEALGAVVKKRGSEVCCIAAVDLSHVGRRFGQEMDMSPELLRRVESADRAMINTILSGEAETFVREILQDQDRRNVCGVPAIYALLRVLDPREGKLLRYEQAVDAATQSMVSFMAGAFY